MPHFFSAEEGGATGREERFRLSRPSFALRRAWTFRRETPSPKQRRKAKLERRKLSRILTM